MTDAPATATSPLATGIVTTTYSYPMKAGSIPPPPPPGLPQEPVIQVPDRKQPSNGSTARMFHDCGGEWVSVNEVSYDDSVAWYKLRCAGCGSYGKSVISYPKVKTS